MISFSQAVKRQVLIQFGPMKTKMRNLDMVQLLVCAGCQTGIFRDGKANLPAAFHADDDPAIQVGGGDSCVN